MSRKRRVFDIEFDEVETAVPAGTDSGRRGPMAAAIVENAEAVTERQAAESAIRRENDALAHEHARLKKAGLITDVISVDLILADKLARDRAPGRDEEIDELKASIREIGLSNPIRVEEVDGEYQLIQGFRRLTAYRELAEESEEYAQIPAVINARGEETLLLYRRMVDENMVRRGVSFAELAQLAIAYRTQDPNLESYDQAVEVLFASTGRQKRAYIKNFVRLLVLVGGDLQHPEAVPRALGLSLLKRLNENDGTLERLKGRLASRGDRTTEEELAILQDALADKPAAEPKAPIAKTGKTTFKMSRPEGAAKCTASDGRLEIRLDLDFSGIERQKLEGAVQAFFEQLDQ